MPDYRGIKGFVQKMLDRYKTKEQEKEEALHDALNPKPVTIISDVLHTMLKNIGTSIHTSDAYPIMNAALVKSLLMACGEYERASDQVLIDKMVEAASSHSGLFDPETFVNALTNDLSLWTIGCEDNMTTTFYDVYGFESYPEMDAVTKQAKDDDANKEREAAKLQHHREDEANQQTSKAGTRVSYECRR
jgi:hypothetical protein